MILQGPHQSAYPSMTTGASVPLRTASSVASVTAMGRSSRIGRPQLPHLGRSAIRVRSTRLSVPQNGQATVARLLTSVTDTVYLRWNLLVALHDRFRLDLHQHLRGYDPAHRHQRAGGPDLPKRSEEHTSELQSLAYLVCRLLLEKKKKKHNMYQASPDNNGTL